MRVALPLTLSASLLCPAALVPASLAQASAPHPAAHPHATHPPSTPSTSLPVTHVSLYKSGVGFFEHTTHVTGNASVTLDLTSAQLDDVLQTLTAIDLGGGTVTGANYNSTTPLDQQLRALPFSLGTDTSSQPTEADLYASLRGARVEVLGSGAPFTGRILSLETRPAPPADPNQPARPVPERRILTVVADTGAIRSLDLTPATTVHLLDPSLRSDLNTYLALLNTNRSEGVRHLTLTDRGAGTRELRVSFLSEVPVWKSTYRLLLTKDLEFNGNIPSTPLQSATLQGFSVIDNTTGEDWTDVHLSLIAGAPQSFLQPLATPIYNRRPEIPIAEDAQLTPQTHDSALDALSAPTKLSKADRVLREDAAPPPQVAGVAGMSGMAGGSAGGPLGSGTGAGIGGGGGNVGAGFLRQNQTSETVAVTAAPMVPYETAAIASSNPNTTTTAFDNLFAYDLAQPVSIPRNGSALVPTLQVQLPVEVVTLWSPAAPTPLRAVWMTNNSKLTLDRGSFTVIENGTFAGEGLTDPVHPGERRLLSFAADQAVHVSVDNRFDTRKVTSLSLSNGLLRAANTEIAEVEYLVNNTANTPRVILVEEPRRPGWTLDADTGNSSDPRPAETTAAAYRFRVATAPHQTVRLHIGQRHTLDQYFQFANGSTSSDDQLVLYLRNSSASPALLAELEPVFVARRSVAGLDTQIANKQAAIDTLVSDQKRLRDNLAALKGSAEERSLVRRYTAELNSQEDTLASLHRDLADLQAQRVTAAAALNNTIANLHLDGTA